MKKMRVIVCGSTFGQYYIRALKTVQDEFEIVGLLANGSSRSKLCADFYHVPLYTHIEDVPEVDIACVVIRSRAVGGNGTDMAEYFLNKKIHVIQEQPIHTRDVEECYRVAKKNHVLFQVGDLYPNLIEVENFIKCARYLNEKEAPLYLRASFCPQVSYPAIDIMSRILPSVHMWKVKSITKGVGPFEVLLGEIGKVPVLIEYHNQVNPNDPDNYMHLLHSFSIFYSSGHLTLEDTFGPVLWKPRMHVPKELYMPNADPDYPPYMLENSIENIGLLRKRSYKDIITEEWPVAISKDLLKMKQLILTGDNGNQSAQQGLLRSKKWSEMTKYFGYAELVNNEVHHYLPFKDLNAIEWRKENE